LQILPVDDDGHGEGIHLGAFRAVPKRECAKKEIKKKDENLAGQGIHLGALNAAPEEEKKQTNMNGKGRDFFLFSRVCFFFVSFFQGGCPGDMPTHRRGNAKTQHNPTQYKARQGKTRQDETKKDKTR
jgi:hypothetical protein